MRCVLTLDILLEQKPFDDETAVLWEGTVHAPTGELLSVLRLVIPRDVADAPDFGEWLAGFAQRCACRDFSDSREVADTVRATRELQPHAPEPN